MAALPVAEVIPDGWRSGWIVTTSTVSLLGVVLASANGLTWLAALVAHDARDHAFAVRQAVIPLRGFILKMSIRNAGIGTMHIVASSQPTNSGTSHTLTTAPQCVVMRSVDAPRPLHRPDPQKGEDRCTSE